MEKYIALLGALGLIFFVLVSVSLLVNFFIKGFYVYTYKHALASQASEKPKKFEIADLFSECEEQKVWLCMLWQRPLSTLVAAATAAAAIRLELGLSTTLGLATLAFIVVGILLPLVVPSMPSFKVFSKRAPSASQALKP